MMSVVWNVAFPTVMRLSGVVAESTRLVKLEKYQSNNREPERESTTSRINRVEVADGIGSSPRPSDLARAIGCCRTFGGFPVAPHELLRSFAL